MAKKPLENTYELANINTPMGDGEVARALTDFEYLCGHYMQIVNKDRKMVPFELNRAQRYIFETLWPMLDPKTRLDRHRQVVVVKGRQVGMSVSAIAFVNYICAFAYGIENTSILHVFPQVDTISKLTKRKVEPIITGIHPDIQPTIVRDTIGSSIVYTYTNLLGVPRRNTYELISASSNSVRGDTINISLFDECSWYRHPEELEDIVGGAMPDHGFSLSVYFSTYGERYNDFFKRKIQAAIDNPDEMDLIFVPWFLSYPEQPLHQDYHHLVLSEYELKTIIPELQKYKVPESEWGDKILWYRRKKLSVPHMEQEFPTTIQEVMTMSDDKRFFSDEALSFQRENQLESMPYTLATDNITKEVRAIPSGASNFHIIKPPVYGRKYMLVADPITAQNEETDNFAMAMFDIEAVSIVATFCDKNMPVEDYADIAVAMAKLYNKAMICPESNAADAFVVCIKALGYYNFYYSSQQNRAKKIPGIRTSATSKEAMLSTLTLLLEQKRIRVNDKATIDEMYTFEKKVKRRTDGSVTVKAAARKGKHDDRVSCLWLFAGTLSSRQISGRQSSGFSVIHI